MAAILAIAAVSLLASFICSLFEAALYALTPSEVEVLRGNKVFGADRMARMRANIEEPIAAILTINTVANTLGATLGGFLAGQHYGDYYAALHGEGVRDEYGEAGAAVFGVCFTLAVLLFSEIIPKSVGVRYARPLVPFITWPLQWMIWVSWPVARGARALMHVLTRSAGDTGPSSEEVLTMSRLAREGGSIRAEELAWVENALQLDCVTAHDLMTPRTVVDSLPAEMALTEVKAQKRQWVHTRLPLYEEGNPDAIVGLVHGKDLFMALLEERTEGVLRDFLQPIDFVPETLKGHELLDKFIKENKHLVAVVDEYGGFEGIVTLEDVLECLLGSEIVDEHDKHEDMQVVARRMARMRAREMRSASEAPTQELLPPEPGD